MHIGGGLILKSTETAKVPHKSGTTDLWNSPPYKKLAYFYMTITGNFECFHYSNFEISFLKNIKLFSITEALFFSWKYNHGRCHILIQKCPFLEEVKTNKMLKQIEWEVQNGLIAKNRVSSLTNLFFSNFNFGIRTSFK